MNPWQILADTIFKTPLSLLSNIFSSKMGLFVYGIMSKWYIMIMLGSAIVAFWVLKGLEESGVLSEAYDTVSSAMEDSKAIARYCTPKIRNLSAMWDCIENIGKYQRTQTEQDLYDAIEKASGILPNHSEHQNHHEDEDPYSNNHRAIESK